MTSLEGKPLRAELLADEVLLLQERLRAQTDAETAALFFERLARLERSEVHLSRRGLTTLAEARALRTNDGARLAAAVVAGFDLQGLLDAAHRVAAGHPDDVEAVAEDLLLLAELTPFLPASSHARFLDAAHLAVALVEAHPGQFTAASELAQDRRLYEESRGAPEPLRELLAALDETPHAAEDELLLDRYEPAAALVRAFDSAVDAGRTRVAPSVSKEAAPSFLDALRALLLPAATPGVVTAYADTELDLPEHVRLRSVDLGPDAKGEFLLTRRGERLFVEWHGVGAPQLFEEGRDGVRAVESGAFDGSLRWPFGAPSVRRWAEFGPESVDLTLADLA